MSKQETELNVVEPLEIEPGATEESAEGQQAAAEIAAGPTELEQLKAERDQLIDQIGRASCRERV